MAAKIGEAVAAVVSEDCVRRSELDGHVVGCEGFSLAVESLKCEAAVDMAAGDLRVERDGDVASREGIGITAEGVKGAAAVDVAHHELRIELDGLVVSG